MAQDENLKAETGSLDVGNPTIAPSPPRPSLSPAPSSEPVPIRALRPAAAAHHSVLDSRQASPAWNRSTASRSANALRSEESSIL